MVLVIDEYIDIIFLNGVSKYNIDRLQISDDVWEFIVFDTTSVMFVILELSELDMLLVASDGIGNRRAH